MARPKPKPSTSTPKSRALQRSAGRTAASQRSAQTYYGAKPTVSESGFSGLARAAISIAGVAGRAAAQSSRAAQAARAAGRVQRPGGVGAQSRAGKGKTTPVNQAAARSQMAQTKRETARATSQTAAQRTAREKAGKAADARAAEGQRLRRQFGPTGKPASGKRPGDKPTSAKIKKNQRPAPSSNPRTGGGSPPGSRKNLKAIHSVDIQKERQAAEAARAFRLAQQKWGPSGKPPWSR